MREVVAMNGSKPELRWQRSALCGNATCIEIAFAEGAVFIRDSKHPDRDPLEFTLEEWNAFAAGVCAGSFKPA
jgi:hypothetical protein